VLFMGWQWPRGGYWDGDIDRLVLRPDFWLVLDGVCQKKKAPDGPSGAERKRLED
jgi:hypothetical protein